MSIDNADIPDVDQEMDPTYEPTLEEEHSGFSWDPSPRSSAQSQAGSSLPRPLPMSKAESLREQIVNPFTGGGIAVGLLFGFLLRGCFVASPPPENKIATDISVESVESVASTQPTPTKKEKTVEIINASASKPSAAIVVPNIAPKKVSRAGKKFISNVKLYPKGSYRIADINTGGHKFKYRSQVIRNPYRLVIDITGLNGTATKSKINAGASLAPVKSVRIQKRTANKVRVVIDLKTSRKPNYNITRTSSGLRVSIRR